MDVHVFIAGKVSAVQEQESWRMGMHVSEAGLRDVELENDKCVRLDYRDMHREIDRVEM